MINISSSTRAATNKFHTLSNFGKRQFLQLQGSKKILSARLGLTDFPVGQEGLHAYYLDGQKPRDVIF